jgi:hypothetical protein
MPGFLRAGDCAFNGGMKCGTSRPISGPGTSFTGRTRSRALRAHRNGRSGTRRTKDRLIIGLLTAHLLNQLRARRLLLFGANHPYMTAKQCIQVTLLRPDCGQQMFKIADGATLADLLREAGAEINNPNILIDGSPVEDAFKLKSGMIITIVPRAASAPGKRK